MTHRNHRSLNVSMTSAGLLVSLVWFEHKDDGDTEIKATHLDYPSGQVTESVEQAINIMAGGWERMFTTNQHMSVVAHIQENDNALFDMVADAEQPEQAFISRYVLEYQGGKHATRRIQERQAQQIMQLRFGHQGV